MPDPVEAAPRRRLLPLVAAALLLLAVAGWPLLYDPAMPGPAVLGGYRESSFLALVGLGWCSLVALWLAWRRRGRRQLLQLVLLHASLAATLLVLEALGWFGLLDYPRLLGLAPFDVPPAEARAHGVRHLSRPHMRSEAAAMPDLALHLGAPAVPITVATATDAHGLRNPTPKTDPAIVCLGDSLLVGSLVADAELLTEQLQGLLAVQVMNCSEVRYSPQEEWRRLLATRLPLQGRVVVQFLFEGNDLADSAAWRRWTREPGSDHWPPRSLLRCLLFLLKSGNPQGAAVRRASFRARDGNADVWFYYDARSIAEHADELPQLAQHVAETAAAVTAAGGRYAVCVVPMKLRALAASCDFPADTRVDRDAAVLGRFAATAAAACAEAQVPFLDLAPALAAQAGTGELPYFAADTHLNAVGHRTVAAAVAPWLQPLLPGR